jgi:hypothetical protein
VAFGMVRNPAEKVLAWGVVMCGAGYVDLLLTKVAGMERTEADMLAAYIKQASTLTRHDRPTSEDTRNEQIGMERIASKADSHAITVLRAIASYMMDAITRPWIKLPTADKHIQIMLAQVNLSHVDPADIDHAIMGLIGPLVTAND